MAIGLFALSVTSSICTHQFFYRSAGTGVLIRGALISAIYGRSMRLTSRARSKLPNGLIVNFISVDVSRIDFCAGFFHMVCYLFTAYIMLTQLPLLVSLGRHPFRWSSA